MKVYDCFPFFNELELLDIRLKILNDVVDYFVLCELPVTQTGNPKKFYYKENEEKFAKYKDKIIHIAPEYVPVLGEKTVWGKWDIEYYQRNCIFSALNGRCDDDDVIIISDADEIVNPAVIRNIKTMDFKLTQPGMSRFRQLAGLYYLMGGRRFFSTVILRKHRNIYDLLDYSPVGLRQRLFMYYMNVESEDAWIGSTMVKWKCMLTPRKLRKFHSWIPMVENGGYHFTALGGAERVKTKLNSLVEGYACDDQKADELIEKSIKNETGGIDHITNARIRLIKKEELGFDREMLIYIEKEYPYLFRDERES